VDFLETKLAGWVAENGFSDLHKFQAHSASITSLFLFRAMDSIIGICDYQ
jgi:hypothetical protein